MIQKELENPKPSFSLEWNNYKPKAIVWEK